MSNRILSFKMPIYTTMSYAEFCVIFSYMKQEALDRVWNELTEEYPEGNYLELDACGDGDDNDEMKEEIQDRLFYEFEDEDNKNK